MIFLQSIALKPSAPVELWYMIPQCQWIGNCLVRESGFHKDDTLGSFTVYLYLEFGWYSDKIMESVTMTLSKEENGCEI